METNVQKLNDHTHDGTNSAKLSPANFSTTEQVILAASWVSLGGGNYKQTVTCSAGFLFDTSVMSFRDPDGSYIHPSVRRLSASTFDVYTNDNTIDMHIFYGV